ncbi:hypothetical protein VaNZ11_001834 [Volvox africanus]|uniref:Transmembrane protein n=1 Tax=Volvox africanus TaxID=51714 RepID=A0ABQ5RR07_9CHLO|nr:hypothetical protein VaNZ11_001834 [Volvox africanus]
MMMPTGTAGTGPATMTGTTTMTTSAAGGNSQDGCGGDGGGRIAMVMAALRSMGTAILSAARQCLSRGPSLDSTLYLPTTFRCQERCHHGCLRPADFCCSCLCGQGCPCSCCACCDLRRSVCAAASWQFVVGGLLGSGFAAITAISFSREPDFGNPDATFYALMIHLLVFWWLYFLCGAVGCCTVLDRQGILTYDPRAMFMSQLYLGLNILCILCHITLAVLNKALWHNALSRLAIFITFVPLAWDWYITYLAWSLIHKMKKQRKGIFQGRPVMHNQSKPGQVLELHTGHNLALSPPPGQAMVPVALGILGSVRTGVGAVGGLAFATGPALQLGTRHQVMRAGPHWPALSIDTSAHTFFVNLKRPPTTTRALSTRSLSPTLRSHSVIERSSRSAAVISIHARSGGGGGGEGEGEGVTVEREGARGSGAVVCCSRQPANYNNETGSVNGNVLDSNSFSGRGIGKGNGGLCVGGGAGAGVEARAGDGGGGGGDGTAGTDITDGVGGGRWGSSRRKLIADSRGCSGGGNIPRDDDDGGGGGGGGERGCDSDDGGGDEGGDVVGEASPSTFTRSAFGRFGVEQQHVEVVEGREGVDQQRQQQQQRGQWQRSWSSPPVPSPPLGGAHGV